MENVGQKRNAQQKKERVNRRIIRSLLKHLLNNILPIGI